MKIGPFLLYIVSLAIAGSVGWYTHRAFADSGTSPTSLSNTPPPPPAVRTVNGETVVVVSADEQRASHIEVAPLVDSTSRPDVGADATVIDLQPLFELRNRMASARADVEVFRAQAVNSGAQYQRSRALFADDRNVSRKSLQEAQSTMQADESRLRSANARVSALDAAMRQQFGGALTRAAAASTSKLFQRLQSRQAVVLRVTLPADFGKASPPRITVDTPDGRLVSAQRLSASPLVDPTVQGGPWLYVAEDALPANLHVSARVPTTSQAVAGLLIPERAVVWYGGQTWTYVRTAHDRFTRRSVPAIDDGGRGFTVTSGFHAGDRVVTQGAQLLLSEELKPQGVATACKDPPECDD